MDCIIVIWFISDGLNCVDAHIKVCDHNWNLIGLIKGFVSPLGESLSGACPPESNQRGRHPAITACGSLALLATAATLNIAARVSLRRNRPLRSLSYQQSGRPSKLALAACKRRKPPRNSNSRWPTTPTSSPLLSVMGWDSSHQTYIVEVWTVQKTILFL